MKNKITISDFVSLYKHGIIGDTYWFRYYQKIDVPAFDLFWSRTVFLVCFTLPSNLVLAYPFLDRPDLLVDDLRKHHYIIGICVAIIAFVGVLAGVGMIMMIRFFCRDLLLLSQTLGVSIKGLPDSDVSLLQMAESKLVSMAKVVDFSQKQCPSDTANKARFREAHEIFMKFALVNGSWGSYFEKARRSAPYL